MALVAELEDDNSESPGLDQGLAFGRLDRESMVDDAPAEFFSIGLAAGERRAVFDDESPGAFLIGLAAARGRVTQDDLDDAASSGFSVGVSIGGGGSGSGGSDSDEPDLTVISPDPGEPPGDPGAFPASYAAARDTPIAITVADAASDVAFVVISVRFTDPAVASGLTNPATVYAGRPPTDGVAGYQQGYSLASTVTGTGAVGVGIRFDVRNDTGWPGQPHANSEIRFDVKAVDSQGNVLA